MKNTGPVLIVLAALLVSGLVRPPAARAAMILPPLYRGGIDLIAQGNTVSRALTCWKDVVYVSVDAQTCWPNQPASAATVYAVDASNPTNMQYLTKSSIGGCKANGLAAFEDKLYVANWSELLRTFDICDRSQINPLGIFHVPGDASWTLSVKGERVYLGEAHELAESFYIIDVANPASPRLVSATDWAGSPAVAGAYSYYRDGTWFKVLNISDETAPVFVAGVDLGVNLGDPQLRGNHAFVSWTIGSLGSGTSGVVCVDISDPLAPREAGRWTTPSFYFLGAPFLLGDLAFLPTSGNGIFAVNIADPTNMFSVAQFEVPYYALELAVAGNGRHLYAGTVEGDRDGGVHCWQVFTQDPDDAGPGNWRNFSPRQTSWDTQYEADAMPGKANPPWTLLEGSEQWASISDGVLRINDTGTVSGDKVKWVRNWEATSSRGGTVMARARCAFHNTGGAFIPNLVVSDGKYEEEFAILTNKFCARNAVLEYALDGSQWHTYRITTLSNQFKVYVDEAPAAVLTGPLTAPNQRARVIFGSGSSPARQDIYFDYVQAFAGGDRGPSAAASSPTPNVSVDVSDLPGRGSLSGLATNTARVHWSNDGGRTWQSSGGALWNGGYDGDKLPAAASPAWHPVEGSEMYASVTNGLLRILDNSTAGNTKLKYERLWRASPADGATLVARARCAAAGGDTTYTGNLFVENGQYEESLKILPDRILARNTGQTYFLDGTQFHIYRLTLRGAEFKVYVDEQPAPVISAVLTTTTANNRVMFGSGASAGTQDIYFDYVRYSVAGALPPGEGDGAGSVPVTVFLPPCAERGVDRCTLSAPGIPFNRYSETENKVRFSMQDIEGNVGWSPIYTVRIPLTDTDGDGMDDQWERTYFGSLARTGKEDDDGDGQSNYAEFQAGTNPRNPLSVFEIIKVTRAPGGLVSIRWNSVAGKTYCVQCANQLSGAGWSQPSNAVVTATGTNASWTSSAEPATQRFYRVQLVP